MSCNALFRRVLLALSLSLVAVPAFSQQPAPAPVPVPVAAGSNVNVTITPAAGAPNDFGEECTGKCCPPSSGKKVMMGVGALLSYLIMILLWVRLVERAFINQNKSPLLGRHTGLSLGLFLGGAGMLGIFYLINDCWHPEYYYWLGFSGVVWFLHGIYTLVALRR